MGAFEAILRRVSTVPVGLTTLRSLDLTILGLAGVVIGTRIG